MAACWHIFFNVMWIRNLGPAAVEAFGPARSFVLFNFAGAVGFLVSNMMSGATTIGASGAVFGLLAALIVYGRKRGSSVLTQQLWQWAIILGIFGFHPPGREQLGRTAGASPAAGSRRA